MVKSNAMRQAILANYDKNGLRKKSWVDLAEENDWSIEYLTQLIGRMRKQGLIPSTKDLLDQREIQTEVARKREARKAAIRAQVAEKPPTNLEGITYLSGSMTREERIKTLTEIGRTGNDLSKIQAIVKLEEFERAAGSTYGPPPPTTQKDTINLLLELLLSLPAEWVAKSIEAYYEAKNPVEAEEEPESGATADSEGDLDGRST